jgi:hypothetical protein
VIYHRHCTRGRVAGVREEEQDLRRRCLEEKRRPAAATDKGEEKQISPVDPWLEPSKLEGEMENRHCRRRRCRRYGNLGVFCWEVTLLFRETHRAFSVSPPISRRPPARTPFPLLAQLEPAFRETTDSDVHWDWLEAAFSSV